MVQCITSSAVGTLTVTIGFDAERNNVLVSPPACGGVVTVIESET